MVRPHIAIITTVAPVHLEYFGSVAKIADAKAEIFAGLVRGGFAVLNRDNDQFARLNRAAKAAGVSNIVTFGEHPKADARLVKFALHADCSTVQAEVLGSDVTYKLGAPGRHLLLNSLAVLAAARLAGADLALAALALARLEPAAGRGVQKRLAMPGGTALLIDESYNANPASMRAAIALLGQARVGALVGAGGAQPGATGRRIAVLGDMLELGKKAGELHAELAKPLVEAGVDLVFCSGPAMHSLWQALPSTLKGGYAETSAALEPAVLRTVRAGDAIMVKGSLGSKMAPIVKALEQQFPRLPAGEPAAQG
jgi:UDP-N-acetylmuramoyl-tripeptide--D-alanyl-D-alanine ligase